MERFLSRITSSVGSIKLFGAKIGPMSIKIAMIIVIIFMIPDMITAFNYISSALQDFFKDHSSVKMESWFCNACSKKSLLSHKETRDYIDSQQFSSLRAFMSRHIPFASMCSILKFGSPDIQSFTKGTQKFMPTCSIVSKNIMINPSLLEPGKVFKYEMKHDPFMGSYPALKEGCSGGRLSLEEKTLYVALGSIGAYNSIRELTLFIEDLGAESKELRKQACKELKTHKEVFSNYMKIYMDLCNDKDSDIDSILKVIGHTLIEQSSTGIASWSDSLIIDKTSLYLMMLMTANLKDSHISKKEKEELIVGMILDREKFNFDDPSGSNVFISLEDHLSEVKNLIYNKLGEASMVDRETLN